MSEITKTLRDIGALVEAGLLVDDAALSRVAGRYAVAVTPAIAALIDRADINDPLARQFLPDARELDSASNESADPIGDQAHSPVEGVVHRHRDRVLLKIVAACPIYCRFCFRRAMIGPGSANTLSPGALERAVAYIAAHPEIWEVILTGGDPFVLTPRRAREISERLTAIPHLQVIRWHTRMPVADPAQVTDEFVSALKSTKAVYVSLHANHPRELGANARDACTRLIDAGIPMVSQSVLLKGVNDNVDTLEALMRAFVACRIKPYYLHHCDLAPGTAHFRTTVAEGQALMRALHARLSGLALPTYVLDIPGGFGKVPILDSNVIQGSDEVRVRDANGVWHGYDEAGLATPLSPSPQPSE